MAPPAAFDMRDPRLSHETQQEAPEHLASAARLHARQVAQLMPGRATAEALWDFDGETYPVYELLMSEFIECVRADGERTAAWLAFLDTELFALSRPARLAMLDREVVALESAASEWSAESDPLRVWDSPRAHVRRDDAFSLADVALRLSPQRALPMLESWPLPYIVGAVLSHTQVESDLERLLAMLTAAPRVFDGLGHWLPERPFTALLVAGGIVTHARLLNDGVERSVDRNDAESLATLRNWREVELDAIVKALSDALIARPDDRAPRCLHRALL